VASHNRFRIKRSEFSVISHTAQYWNYFTRTSTVIELFGLDDIH